MARPGRWKEIETEFLQDCRVFTVSRTTAASPRDGAHHPFFRIDSADWVNVVPLTADDDIVMVKQFRHGLREITLETPGGMVDPGEDPGVAAARELLEETGYRAGEVRKLGTVNPNPALFGNRFHTFVALNCEHVAEVSNDEREETVVELVSRRRLRELVAEGQVDHALVLAALHFLDLYDERERGFYSVHARTSEPPGDEPEFSEELMSTPFDLSITDELLSTTRAVRKRLDLKRPVPRDTILDCIRLSQQAPTGSNTQAWRWMVVEDAEKRAQLAALYKATADQYLELARANIREGDTQTERVYDSAFWLVDHLAEVPVHVIPCVEGRVADGAGNAGGAGFYGSIFPAVWSFQLALRSRGLGSALTTLHLFQETEAAKLLGIPDTVSQIALLPVAYTVGTKFKHAKRPGPETITHFDSWS